MAGRKKTNVSRHKQTKGFSTDISTFRRMMPPAQPKMPAHIGTSPSDILPGEWAECLLALGPTLLRANSVALRSQTPKHELQARSYDADNLRRRLAANHGNIESALVQIMGDVVSISCQRRARGLGTWSSCVVLSGFLEGRCAGCFFNSQGSTCSFRERTRKTRMFHQVIPI